ncbi:MAG: hypothetical protein ACREBC_15365, partial [Pyrinomonadaceae bacterium]
MFYEDSTHAQPTRVVVDPQNGTGQQTTSIVYDYSTGLVTSQTDANGQVTTTDYTNQLMFVPDPYGRPGVVTGPAVTSTVGGTTHTNQRRKAVSLYRDAARQVEARVDLNTEGDGLLKSRTSSDQIGRVVMAESSENGSSYSVRARSVYQQMGRISFQSNPTRDDGSQTEGWTRTTLDDLGRVVEVATFSGAAQPPSSGTNSSWTGSVVTSYNAHETTVTDQASKARRSVVDGLGRLVRVLENPNGSPAYQTDYGYDALGNLRTVTQGSQTRSFVYDSLSRLREAFNPEQVNTSQQQVATSYEYDDASNLRRKTNPNGSFVSFTYDGLNRVATKTLSTGGAWTYSYDSGVTNSKGRLVSVVKQGSSEGYYYDGYDTAGRLNASRQITDGQVYSMSYGYDLAGNLTRQQYPSGRVITTSFDNAGRVSQVSGQKTGEAAKTYASSLSYTAAGAVSGMRLGNNLWEHTIFNSRLQPTRIGLGSTSSSISTVAFDYSYGTTTNNGNVATQTIRIGGTTISQSYSYDQVNRLASATESGAWSQTFGYDQYGNRWVSGHVPNTALTPQSQNAFNASTNRLVNSAYDTSGNQTQDAAGRSFGYDAENRQVSFNGGAASYTYDGDGRRVKKVDSTGTTLFVYDVAGRMVAEYTTGAPQGSGTSYLTSDHLGSTRVVTDASGGVKSRRDYLPFGEEIATSVGGRGSIPGYGGNDGVKQLFTSKERDGESGLDYFLARYYSSAQGRFLSIDPENAGTTKE